MKRRRVRMEIEVTRRRRGQIKSGKSSLASNQFPICSPQSGTLREVQSFIKKRRGKKEIEVTRRRGEGVKRRETNLACDQFPVFSTAQNTQRDSQS